MDLSKFPAMNAALNGTSALLLILGYVFIRQRAVKAHTMSMAGAFFTSTVFLISYLYYHYHHGSTPFQGQGAVRWIYFTVLLTHTVLAIVIVPLIIMTLIHAVKGNFPKHAKIARVTFPLWLYVSVTGVVIYWMLYRMPV